MLAIDYKNQFLGWQCRIRQIAMREDEGRPSAGMRPRLLSISGEEITPGIIVLIIRNSPFESTEFFKFQVQKQKDPQEIYKSGLKYLQSTHYHGAQNFDDEMMALFASGSQIAKKLKSDGNCTLDFNQFNQRYTLPCKARSLGPLEPAFGATLWHNRLFNPSLSDEIEIIGFKPDWDAALEQIA